MPDRMRRLIGILAAAAAAVLLVATAGQGASAAAVHTALLSSSPAAGDTIHVGAFDRLELRFSGPVDVGTSEIALIDGSGSRSVLRPADSGDVRTVAGMLGIIRAGGYRVEWRTIAADGHPVTGSFVFYVVGNDSVATEPLLPPPPPSAAVVNDSPPTGTSLLRAGAIGSLGALAGLLLFLGWIAPPGEHRLRSLATVLAWAAPVLLIGHAVGWAGYAAGGSSAGPWDLLQSTPAARMELVRITLALLALWALVLARRTRIAAGFALGAVLASGYAGHSAVFSPLLLVPGRALHITAFAIWAGALLTMRLLSRKGVEFLEVTRTLSTLALIAVITLLGSGLAHLLLFPTSFGLLARSTYGLLIAGKVAGLVVLSAFGARNRLKLIPSLPDPAAEASLRRTVGWELGIMALVIVATGFLSYVPVPQTASAEAPVQLTPTTSE